MAANTIIQIKRSQTSNTPLALANGELAYSYSSNKLYIGQTSNSSVGVSVEYIGGKLLVDKVANLESQTYSSDQLIQNLDVSEELKLSYANGTAVLATTSDGVVDFLTGSSGKVLQISDSGNPVFDDLNGGTY